MSDAEHGRMGGLKAKVTFDRAPLYRRAYLLTSRQAWAALTDDPSDENRVVFGLILERLNGTASGKPSLVDR